MNTQEMLDLVLRWMHMLGAAGLVGGTLFMRFGLWPSLAGVGGEERARIFGGAARKFAPWVGIFAGFVLLSGIFNFVNIVRQYSFPGGYYHAVGGLKLILGIVVIGLLSILCGRTSTAEKWRKNAGMWLDLCLILGIAMVLMGGLLRVAKRTEKERPAVTTPE